MSVDTCEIKHLSNLEIISVFFSHVTTSETEIKLFRPLKDFCNYFEIISATMNVLKNIHELQYAFEIISGKFPRTEIKLFADGRRRRLK